MTRIHTDNMSIVESPVSNRLFSRFADTNGDGTGLKSLIADYSSAAEEVFIAPAAGEVMVVSRVIISVEDAGTFDAAKWGNNITLTNGIKIFEESGGVEITDYTDGLPIKSSGEAAARFHDVTIHSFGTGNQILSGRYTFAKHGKPIRLVGELGDRLVVELNDNFTGLVAQKFLFQGYYENLPE